MSWFPSSKWLASKCFWRNNTRFHELRARFLCVTFSDMQGDWSIRADVTEIVSWLEFAEHIFWQRQVTVRNTSAFGSLTWLPIETAPVFFPSHFLKKKQLFFLSSSCFLYLFNASRRLFCALSFTKSHKILSKFSKLSTSLNHRKLCNVDVNHASVL